MYGGKRGQVVSSRPTTCVRQPNIMQVSIAYVDGDSTQVSYFWGDNLGRRCFGRFEEVGFLGISGSVSREAICASN